MKRNFVAIIYAYLLLISQMSWPMQNLSDFIGTHWKKMAAVTAAYLVNNKITSYLADKPVTPTTASDTEKTPEYPIVYDPQYNISLLGPIDQYIHPFDGAKYGKVASYLRDAKLTTSFHKPISISNADLLKVHSKEYLESTKSSWNIAFKIMSVFPLALVPNWFLQWRVLRPMRLATGGTLKAVDLALQQGYAINIGGGYHHAQSDSYPKIGGYCVYGDIQLAVKRFHEQKPNGKILIIDLDAHQGNGYEYDLHANKNVRFFDIYNKNDYPGYDSGTWWHSLLYGNKEEPNRKHIHYNYPIDEATTEEQYLKMAQEGLTKALEEFKPDLIIYNAGTDILDGDPEGKLHISEAGIIKRDHLIFEGALSSKTPIIMLTSGGYTSKTAGIIGRSIENVLNTVIKRPATN